MAYPVEEVMERWDILRQNTARMARDMGICEPRVCRSLNDGMQERHAARMKGDAG